MEVYEAQEVLKTTIESQKTLRLDTSSQKNTLRRIFTFMDFT